MAKKEEKKLSFAGRSLNSRDGKMDEMLEKGSTEEELIDFVLEQFGKDWAKSTVKWYMKGLEKIGAIKTETKIVITKK